MAHKDTEALVEALVKAGWRVESGKHYIAYPPDKALSPVTFAKTPSDHRSFANTISRLRQRGFQWKGR
jgi:hypothetical protein